MTTTTLCLVSLMLKEIGDSAESQLEYLSKKLILDDFRLFGRPLENSTSSFGQIALECEEDIDGKEILDDDLYRSIQDLVSSRNVDDNHTSPKLWQELSRMTSLEGLNIGMKQQSWVSTPAFLFFPSSLTVFRARFVLVSTST